jgi:pyrroline-5-carboxylate reductase
MKISVIGCGNMGSALINGMLSNQFIQKEDLRIYDVDNKKTEGHAEKWGLTVSKNLKEAVSFCGLLLIAIKPQDMEVFLTEITPVIDQKNKIVLSIAAGVRSSLYRKYIHQARLVRVMPNIPAFLGEGAAGIYFNGDFTADEKKNVLGIFESCGSAEEVGKEDLLDIVTGLSGSGPAYVFTFINSLADAAVLEGLPRDTARRLAVQTVIGSAIMASDALKNDIHLEELKDRVTSPGGTTAAGLFALEEGAFRGTVIRGVREAVRRSRELGGK